MFQKAKAVIAGGLEVSAPALAIRGVGMSALGLGGGLEEVVDFRNREIGQFRHLWPSGVVRVA